MMYKSLLVFFFDLVFVNCASFKQGFVSPKTCETKECTDAAEHIKKWMNPALKPCEDFYEFSCGYWHSPDNQTINKQHTSSMGSRGDLFDSHLKTFLNNETVEKESNLFQMAKQFVNLCLDGVSIEARGVAPAVQHLKAAGGWPVLEKVWCEKHWDPLRAEILFGGVFFKIEAQPTDFRMTNDFVILPGYVDDKYFGRLSQGFESKVAQERYKNLTELAELFGADKKKAEVEMREALQFEIDLSEFGKGITSTLKTYHNRTELQNDITWLNWTQLVTSLLPESMNIPDNLTVVVLGKDYVKELGNFINKYPKRTIANYMMAKGAASLVKYLPTPVDCPDDPSMPRYNICVEIVKSSSLSGILASYMARQMIEETRVATEITRRILDELFIEVKGLEWLDEETRSLALSKLKETKLFISFPDELLNIDTVEDIYKEVKINNSHFFEAAMDSEKWVREEKFSKLGKSFSDITIKEKIDTSLTLNSQFIKYLNAIFVSAGFLHHIPLFSPKLPSYINYGHFGSIIAHELTHALDMQTDDSGEFKQQIMLKWKSNTTEGKYKEKKQCIIDQYSSINDTKFTGRMLDGQQTQKEDIADIGGFKLAFRAYKKSATKLIEPEAKLPGLQQYSAEQLFAISVANAFCRIGTADRVLSEINYDTHSPFEFRINGMMRNSADFSKLFSCKTNDYMNPEKKCSVW